MVNDLYEYINRISYNVYYVKLISSGNIFINIDIW
jgi:hypothetical protein